jgi:hypothetical protein
VNWLWGLELFRAILAIRVDRHRENRVLCEFQALTLPTEDEA